MALFSGEVGQFLGVKSPIKPAGKYYIPPHLMVSTSGTTVATTGARYYIVPWYIERPTAVAGSWCYNGGTGDNGDKAKMAIYSEATAGGPGARAASFGEITFTGASAIRTFASSVTLNPGMHYLEFVTDNAVTMFCMGPMVHISAAGAMSPNHAANVVGSYGITVGGNAFQSMPAADYVGGTYANFPESSSLTPTTTEFGAATCPLFGLYA